MKSFQAVIIAALAVSSAAINEPVASPTAAIERELAEYERQLGTDVSPAPTPDGGRGVSLSLCCLSCRRERVRLNRCIVEAAMSSLFVTACVLLDNRPRAVNSTTTSCYTHKKMTDGFM